MSFRTPGEEAPVIAQREMWTGESADAGAGAALMPPGLTLRAKAIVMFVALGAFVVATLFSVGQQRGRDLRQDHIEEPRDRACPTLTLHVQDEQIVKVLSPDDASVTHGNLCIKGRFGTVFVQNRP